LHEQQKAFKKLDLIFQVLNPEVNLNQIWESKDYLPTRAGELEITNVKSLDFLT